MRTLFRVKRGEALNLIFTQHKTEKHPVWGVYSMAEGVERKRTLFESSTFHTSAQTRRDKPHRSYRHSEALRQARFK